MKKNGVSWVLFLIILVSGLNLVKLYVIVLVCYLKEGDLVILDFGYFVDGYMVDMIWIFVVGQFD